MFEELGPERRPPAGQRRQPAARQPLRLARGRDARDADRRAGRQPGRGELLGPLDPAARDQEEGQAAAPTRRALPRRLASRRRPAGATDRCCDIERAPRRARASGPAPPHAHGRRARRARACCSTASRCCCSARTTTSASPTTRACARRPPTPRCATAPARAPRGWSREHDAAPPSSRSGWPTFKGTRGGAAVRLGLPRQHRRRSRRSPARARSSSPTSSTTPASSTAAGSRGAETFVYRHARPRAPRVGPARRPAAAAR